MTETRIPASELKAGDVIYGSDTVTNVYRHARHEWRVVADTTGGEYSFPETTGVPVTLPEPVAFFLEHAGFSYDPATETPDVGRYRSAVALAEAEAWAQRAGVVFRWEDDWAVDHVAEYDCYEDEGPDTCEVCLAYLGDDVVASVGCVDDATDEYRRVIEAELASEAMYEMERAYVSAYDSAIRRLVSA